MTDVLTLKKGEFGHLRKQHMQPIDEVDGYRHGETDPHQTIVEMRSNQVERNLSNWIG